MVVVCIEEVTQNVTLLSFNISKQIPKHNDCTLTVYLLYTKIDFNKVNTNIGKKFTDSWNVAIQRTFDRTIHKKIRLQTKITRQFVDFFF